MLKKIMTRKTRKAAKRKEFLSGLQFETLERRELLAGDLGAAYADVAEGEGDHSHGHELVGDLFMNPGVHQGGDGYVTQPVLGYSPREVGISFLQDNAADFGLVPADFQDYVVLSEYVSQHTRVTHLVLQQQHNGVLVENAVANVAIDNDGRILSAGANFVNGLESSSEPISFSPVINSIDAYQVVVSAVGGTIETNPYVTSTDGGVSQSQTLSGGGASAGDVSVELAYLPVSSGSVELAWKVQYLSSDGDAKYRGFVNAETGSLNYALDLVLHASYDVYPLPGQHPDDTSVDTVTDSIVNLDASPFGWHDTNGIVGAEVTDTRGNNVFAQGGDVGAFYNATGDRAEGGVDLIFSAPYDELAHSTTQENVEAQALQSFYVMNVLHDVYHNYGFDEAAGNYQATNYTGTGLGGDQIIINVSDPDASPCNAYYVPAIDGEPGIIEMGFCNQTAPNRGTGMDSDVLIHEHGHAVHQRLAAGPYLGIGSGAPLSQPRAMSEGYADFLPLWFQMDVNDTPEQAEYIGEYSFGVPEGIRSQPYSYDMSVNPNTFDGFTAANITGPYEGGEMWASTLFDLTWELIFKYGGTNDASAMELAFNEDIYQSVGRMPGAFGGLIVPPGIPVTTTLGMDSLDYTTGANNLALQLILDGMKLSPFASTFTTSRDAILAADTALTGGVNHDVIWKAFARRGLGYSSFPGLDESSLEVAAAYDLPPTPADIAGTVFIDADADGIRDLGESPIQGAQIFLDLNDNGTHERLEPWTTTDSNGEYNFMLYTGGAFSVKAIQQEDMQQTLPDPTQVPGGPIVDGGHDVYVVTGQSTANVDFGYVPNDGDLGINGRKFNDVNGNGVMDPGEVGVAGVFIYIDQDMDGRIDIGEPATRTGEDGSYYIEFNEGGTYHIREVVEPGWMQVSPAAGYHEVVVIPGLSNYDVDFANSESSDYGDLPVAFDGTNPASHGLLDGLLLGAAVDADPGPNNGVQANGDDVTGVNDDDGVVFIDNLVRGMDDVTMEVTASIGDNSSALLNAWIDFDGDGAFDSDSEQIVSNLRLSEGVNSIDISIPTDAQIGATYARFRYGYEANIGPNGEAMAGEVEDYRLDASFSGGILDDQPYAIDDTFSVTQGDVAVSLDVLANDFGSSNGPATLVAPNPNPIPTGQGGSALVNLATGRIFYTPAEGFVGTDTFNYEVTDGAGEFDSGTVTVHVLPQFADPVAIDDYQILTDTSVGGENIISVLDNDIQGSSPPLNIVSWTNGNHGNVVLDGNNLKYVRSDANPYTLDTFTYTIVDATGDPTSTATVTVELAENVDTVEYIVEALSPLSGLPMVAGSQVVEGDQFTIRVSVKDSRSAVTAAEAGVYAAYVDMLYDADHLQVVPGSLNHGAIYTDITQGSAAVPGLVNEAGGVQDGVDQDDFDRGFNAMEVFTVDVIAIASTDGEQTLLETDPVDVVPLHDTVVIAPTPATIPTLNIDYNSTSIEILGGEPEALLDTNRDGAITPIDALGIINQLNTFGTGAVAEGESFGLDQAMDVNRDSFVSPLDALAIINYLNDNVADTGEGEGMVVVEQTKIDTAVVANQIAATEAVTADVVDEFLRVRENEIGLSMFTGGSQEVIDDDASDLESAIDDLADDVFGQWS